MSTRTPFIAGNWKMNKTIAEAEAFIADVTRYMLAGLMTKGPQDP